MVIKSIKDIVSFIEQYNIKDYQSIQDICLKSIGKNFIPFHFSDGEKKEKDYYIRHLLIYDSLSNTEKQKKVWIDINEPFNIKDVVKK